MVRSSILALLISTSSTGIWIDGNGAQRSVPCPKSFSEEGIVRLPAQCKLNAPAIALTRAEYLNYEEELAALAIERDSWRQAAEEERAKRKEIEQDLDALIQDFDTQVNVLKSVCMDINDCPTAKPMLQGSALTFTVCAAAWGASKLF